MRRDCEALTTFSLRIVWPFDHTKTCALIISFALSFSFTMTFALDYSNIEDVTEAVEFNRISNRMNNTDEEQSTASLLYESDDSGGYGDDSFSNRVRTEGNICYFPLPINKIWSNVCLARVDDYSINLCLTRKSCPTVYKNDLLLESG